MSQGAAVVLTRMACTRARRCRMFVVAGLQIHVSMREEHARTITYRDDGVGRSSCYTCSHVHAAAAAVDAAYSVVDLVKLQLRLGLKGLRALGTFARFVI